MKTASFANVHGPKFLRDQALILLPVLRFRARVANPQRTRRVQGFATADSRMHSRTVKVKPPASSQSQEQAEPTDGATDISKA